MKTPLSFLKSYKQHNFLLLGGAFVFLMLVYSFSIKKTLNHRQKYQYNLQSVQRAATATSDIARYRAQMNHLQETALQPYDREQLLSAITTFCKSKNLLVRTFPESHSVKEKDYAIVTNTLEVEGDYKGIVSLIYHIEQAEKLTAVSSVRFFMHKDYASRKEKLRCELILRNLEK